MVNDHMAGTARVAHDLGLASWFGGAMFGNFALNPAVRGVSDKADRGRVTNAAWNAYNVVNGLSLAAVAVGWGAARVTEARPDRLTDHERTLAKLKDAFTLAAVMSGVATGIKGAKLAQQAPEGAVPIESGTKPASETPREAASLQRAIGMLGKLNLASGIGIIATNALLSQAGHSRPPIRRALLRRST